MTINAHTKIAAILKQHPDALETIVSISPAFEKLRNPLLRKLMAGRASIAMASKIGGCSIDDFFSKLKPLGFEADKTHAEEEKEEIKEVPGFLRNIKEEQLVKLDVRPVIQSGKDPLNMILEKIKELRSSQVLEIINTFEPAPLMLLLKRQGFESHAEVIREDLVLTYFYKEQEAEATVEVKAEDDSAGWDELLKRYEGKLQITDVRQLEMPLPMMTILEALDNLPAGNALFVYHKRIPVFLLPELVARKLGYRIKEIDEGGVHLLIFKP